MREGLEHELAVLVELDLFTRIRAIRDGAFPNEEEMIEETVISFKKGLPEHLKQIPNCHNIITETLRQVEKETRRIRKMRQEKNKEDEQERY
jgi:hypothetical protein